MSFLQPEVVECLIHWVQEEIADASTHLSDADYTGWDPNDLVIFESFVLPTLVSHRHTGVDSDEILDKGYGFITMNIPSIIKESPNISRTTKSALMKIGYETYTESIRDYIKDTNPENLMENRQFIGLYIEQLNALQNVE